MRHVPAFPLSPGLCIILVVTVMTSCTREYPMRSMDEGGDIVQPGQAALDAGSPASPSGAAAKEVRLPLTGTSEGTAWPEVGETGGPVPCDALEGGFVMRLEGTGRMSHLGRITLSTTHCSSPDPGSGQYAGGFAVYRAENGDELHGAYHQLGAPTDAAMEAIVGGTGRFHSATGELQVKVTPIVEFDDGGVPIFPARFTATYEGWISYEASDRSGAGG